MTLGIVLALAAAAGYGAADFIGGLGSRRAASAWGVVLCGQLTGVVLMTALAVAAPARPGAAALGWAVVAGLGSAVGTLFLYRGLARGRMGAVAPISAVGAALLPVAVDVAAGGRPTGIVWAGVAVALPGIWFVSRESSAPRAGDRSPARGALLDGVVAGLGFGLLFAALAQVPSSAGTLPLALNQLVGAAVTIAVATSLRQPWLPRRGSAGLGAVAGLLGGLGSLAFIVASRTADLTIAAVLASLYPAVTVLLASVALGERVGRPQRLGLVVCTAAVALVAAG